MADPDANLQALVPHTYQGAVIQQRLTDGYINATAMCKAAGKEWSAYRRTDTTEAFLKALQGSLKNHRDPLVQSVVAGLNEHRGTWVHPQVAIHLAQWVSPEFAVLVSEWVFEWLSGKSATDRVWKQFEDRVSLTYDNVPAGYFCIFREIADVFATLFSRGVDPGTRMILDISVGWHWGKHWHAVQLEDQFGERMQFPHYYPKYFKQSLSNPQMAFCYPENALPTFRKWMREIYIPMKMPSYLQTQVRQNRITPQAANNTLAALETRERTRALPRR
jgi:hypothetical protein